MCALMTGALALALGLMLFGVSGKRAAVAGQVLCGGLKLSCGFGREASAEYSALICLD